MNVILARLRRELSREILFDEGIEAARNACVAGASIASAAIVAAAYNDSPLVGVPALRRCMQTLESLPLDVDAWLTSFQYQHDPVTQKETFAPGFGYLNEQQAAFVLTTCQRCFARRRGASGLSRCAFFLDHHPRITRSCGALNRVGLMALVCSDHGVTIEDAERYYMVWRVESAISEAQKARRKGLARFPFLSECHQYEGPWPTKRSTQVEKYLVQIGLEDEGEQT